MSRIVESLERLNVKNDFRAHEQSNEMVGKKIELALEETVSQDQNYILSVCGTQRQILYFLMEYFLSDLQCHFYILYYFIIYLFCYLNVYIQ